MLTNHSPTVYLCGTITTDPKYLNWRTETEEKLATWGIDALSPIRGKTASQWSSNGLDSIQLTIYDRGGFVDRDYRDVRRCDAVLVMFFEPPDRQSIGTWVEFGWADEMRKPIVVASDLPEVIQHPFIWKRAARVCPTLEEAQLYLQFLLGEHQPCNTGIPEKLGDAH